MHCFCKLAHEAQRLLDRCVGKRRKRLNVTKARKIQSLLLFKIAIATANRPSAICKATGEYLNKERRGPVFVLFVEEHKTAKNRGAAPLNIPKRLHVELKRFFRVVRPHIMPKGSPWDHDYIFTKVNGPHDQGSLATMLASFTQRSVGQRVSFRAIRRAAVTLISEMRDVTREDLQSLADSMSYTAVTAQNYYNLRGHRTNTSRRLLDSIFTPDMSDQKPKKCLKKENDDPRR